MDLDRRQFLVKSAAVLAGTITLNGGVGSLARLAAAPQLTVMPMLPSLAARQIGIPQFLTTFGPWIWEFASNIFSGVLVNEFSEALKLDEWLARLFGQEKQSVQDRVGFMADSGFTDYRDSYVYVNGNVSFSPVSHKTLLPNFCVLHHNAATNENVLMEGPASIAQYYGAINWNDHRARDAYDVSAADALLPIGYVDDADSNRGSQFEETFQDENGYNKPFQYKTNAGNLKINYFATDPKRGLGTASLVAARENGGKLLGQDYDIKWL